MRVRCVCGRVLKLRDDHVNHVIRCPVCSTMFRIPSEHRKQKGGEPTTVRRGRHTHALSITAEHVIEKYTDSLEPPQPSQPARTRLAWRPDDRFVASQSDRYPTPTDVVRGRVRHIWSEQASNVIDRYFESIDPEVSMSHTLRHPWSPRARAFIESLEEPSLPDVPAPTLPPDDDEAPTVPEGQIPEELTDDDILTICEGPIPEVLDEDHAPTMEDVTELYQIDEDGVPTQPTMKQRIVDLDSEATRKMPYTESTPTKAKRTAAKPKRRG